MTAGAPERRTGLPRGASLSKLPGVRAAEPANHGVYRTQSWSMSIDHSGLYWKLPTRLESTLTIFGLTGGTHGAASTVCRSMRAHRPRAASGFLVGVVMASLIARSMRGSQNPAAFAFAGPWTRDAQVSSGSKNPDGAG